MSTEEKYLSLKRALFDKCYANLNSEQRRAVYTVNNPLLVLAGAGSGKTTVLVKRIVFIIKYGDAYMNTFIPEFVDDEYISEMEAALSSSDITLAENMLPDFAYNPCPPYRVLAITFTNKAANEIKARLSAAFNGDESYANDIWAGTFHSICMRILRVNYEHLGYKPQFSIYDADDTKKAVASAMKACNIDEKSFPLKSVIAEISRAKDNLLTPEMYATENSEDFRKSKIARIYATYQKQLKASNAMDFDDIIMNTVTLLRENEEIRDYYRRKFKYVCVDEYQDTNHAQFVLTSILASGFRNIMVVGDDDQSIYKFRGATITNILDFDKTYTDATVIKLEQNYRSTSNILNAANAVISNNSGRKGKELWTNGAQGKKIFLKKLDDQNAEARTIVETIYKMVRDGKSYRDFAVLYRTNAQSSGIERALAKSAIPYRMLGGTRFSDRKEIRDIVAYLQLIQNHSDRERLLRIINEPRRKIGNVTLDAVNLIAMENGCSMFEVIENASKYTALSRSASSLEGFASIINGLTEIAKTESLPDLFDAVLEMTGYRQMLIDAGAEEKDRLDNLDEFKSSIIEYVSNTDEPTLMGFLEENALVADVDRYDDSADAVVLMTIHSAKGLEFPIVILPGMEDGIFPGMQNIVGTSEDMEEERRLAYVAITRAKEEIYIFHTATRLLYGQTQHNPVSRFINEIPESLIEKHGYEVPYRTAEGAKIYFKDTSYDVRQPTYKPQDIGITKPYITPQKSLSKETFRPGDRVRHMTFGEGEIISVKPMGADTLYEVVFDNVGTKKLMATYAKLKKI
ncbi:MAG: ATP-dependent DNA helicase PcrA [Ruminococcaceae bacterium]|nr:ATP-dependent DNA helicase PcrA [Oscillospiraceae bacterium]